MTPTMLARRKGGVAVTLSLGRTTFCFVTAHLAAHQGERGQLLERNRDSARILQNLLGDERDACTCFDHLFFFGDLNYRLGSAELPDKVSTARPDSIKVWQEIADEICAQKWEALYARDQLKDQIRSGKAFFGFDDGGPLRFAPTFKRKEKKSLEAEGAEKQPSRMLSRIMSEESVDEREGIKPGGSGAHLVRGVSEQEPSPRLERSGGSKQLPSAEPSPPGHGYNRKRIPSYCDRILALHGPAAAATTRIEQRADVALGEYSDHQPVSAIFETAFLPHAALPDELAFEDTWHLEVRTLTVSIEIGKLRNPSSGWHEMFGDRWLGAVPALHATITAGFLSKGQERMSAPRPPGTMLRNRGPEAELVARWDRNDFALSPVASQLGLEWLMADCIAVHLHAGDTTLHAPVGSARFAVDLVGGPGGGGPGGGGGEGGGVAPSDRSSTQASCEEDDAARGLDGAEQSKVRLQGASPGGAWAV